MDIVLFGIQGSGKGTQAKMLAKEFGLEIFEAGGELRKIAASGSELGETVKSYIDAGNLVPHDIIMQVVKEAILARPQDRRILFDGIPRDEDQKRDFDAIMRDVGRDFHCIQILLPREEAIRRILGRAQQEGRADDADIAIITRRMDTFDAKTMPVIAAYEEAGKLTTVDGAQSVEDVYASLESVMDTITASAA